MPRVSIIVPCYNHAPYLERRLSSILNQTYTDFEIILLDDASSDGSADICRQFARRHGCTFVPNQLNSGSAYKQWNKGLRRAQGQYVWIAESDDFADHRFLEVLVDRLDRNPGCGLAYCQSLKIDEDGTVLGPALPQMYDADPDRWTHEFTGDGHTECARFLIRDNTICNASAVLFRRELYDAVGGVDENLKLASDWKFWASLLRFSGLAYVAEPLNYFRTHPASVRSRTSIWLQLAESCEVMRYILSGVDMSPQELEKFHTRVVVLFMHALITQRPSVRVFLHTLRLASHLRLRLSIRNSLSILQQALEATGRRMRPGKLIAGLPARESVQE
jgi:glycosyltransferase involved in cell wall biosynthesis